MVTLRMLDVIKISPWLRLGGVKRNPEFLQRSANQSYSKFHLYFYVITKVLYVKDAERMGIV